MTLLIRRSRSARKGAQSFTLLATKNPFDARIYGGCAFVSVPHLLINLFSRPRAELAAIVGEHNVLKVRTTTASAAATRGHTLEWGVSARAALQQGYLIAGRGSTPKNPSSIARNSAGGMDQRESGCAHGQSNVPGPCMLRWWARARFRVSTPPFHSSSLGRQPASGSLSSALV